MLGLLFFIGGVYALSQGYIFLGLLIMGGAVVGAFSR